MDVDDAADRVYAVTPEEFTALRDELAKQARTAGDRVLAAQIKALRRPTAVAWLANQLARHEAGDLGALLALGDELRLASASLGATDLRMLSRQRSAVVQALLRQARTLARSLGRPAPETVLRELEQTLLVALADPMVAARLEAGRLTERLVFAGFAGGPDEVASAGSSDGPTAERVAGAAHGGTVAAQADPEAAEENRRAAARRAALQHQLEEAWRAASAAKDVHDAARSALEQSRRLAGSAHQVVVDRRRDLDRAQRDLAAAEASAGAAKEDEERAAADLRAARAAVGARQRDLGKG